MTYATRTQRTTTRPSRRLVRVAVALAAVAGLAASARAAAPDGQLVQFNDNGFWSWFEDERAIIDPNTNRLLISSIASGVGAGGAARDSSVEVVSYDLTTGVTTSPFQLINYKTVLNVVADDHNTPALMVRPDGRYVATYTSHQQDNVIRTRVSTNPGDATSWGAESTLAVISNQNTTYSNTFRLGDGKTYNFFRGHNYDPQVVTSTDDGATYLNPTPAGGPVVPTHLLMDPANASGGRPYLKYTSNGTDRVYFLASTGHPRDSNTGVYLGYYDINGVGADARVGTRRLDGTYLGNLTAYNATAVRVDNLTPVLPANTVVNGTTRTHGWTTDIALDATGNPYVGFTSRVNGSTADHRFYYSRWNGTAMVTNEVARAGGFLYAAEPDYTGCMALSTSDPNTLYVSTKIDPRDGTGLTATAKYELYRGFTTDSGATWQWVPITAGSQVDNLRPVLPKWDDTHTALTWFAGTYTTYQNANTAVVGKFYTGNNGVYTNAAATGTWAVAGNWNENRVGDGMSFIADFSTQDVVGPRTVGLDGQNRTIGQLTFGDANPATAGSWTINNGSLTLDAGVVAPIVNVKTGTARLDTPVSGTAGLVKTGPGTLTLGVANPFGGNVSVNAGTLSVDTLAATGTGTTINLGSAAGTGTLRYTGTGETTAKTIYQSAGAAPNGGTIDMSGTGLLRFVAPTLAAQPAQAHTLTLQGSTAGVGRIDSAVRDGSAANKTGVLKQGTGRWVLAGANTYTAATVVTDGTLELTPAAYADTVLATGGGADVRGGRLVLDYTTTSPAADVKAILTAGYAGNFAAGRLRGTTLAAGQTLGYGDDGDAVTVRVTLPGDSDLNGAIDFDDFVLLQSGFGQTGVTFAQGDYDYNDVVNFDDFVLLQSNFGQAVAGGRAAFTREQFAAVMSVTNAGQVPEPAALSLLGLGTAGLLRRRTGTPRRRRRNLHPNSADFPLPAGPVE